MNELTICPSTLKNGFDSYSPLAIKRLFGGEKVLVNNSFLNDKMKRKYLRIVDERTKRFIRKSE